MEGLAQGEAAEGMDLQQLHLAVSSMGAWGGIGSDERGRSRGSLSARGQEGWMESMVKAGRSTGPKEVLLRLAINRHLLEMQLAAVQIQTSFRRYSAQLRVSKIKRRLTLFHRVTEAIAGIMMEEMVLGQALELSLSVVRVRDDAVFVRTSLDRGIVAIANSMHQEIVLETIHSAVRETIQEAGDRFLSSVRLARPVVHPVRVSTNPLLQVLGLCCAEAADSLIRGVAIEAVLEEVKEFLLSTHGRYVFDQLLHDEVVTLIVELLRQNDVLVVLDDSRRASMAHALASPY